MKPSFYQALMWVLLYLVIISGGAAIASILEYEPSRGQCIASFALTMVLILYLYTKKNAFSYYGFQAISRLQAKKVLYFIPIFIIPCFVLFEGLNKELSLLDIFMYAMMMIFIAFIEELLFRGFLINALKPKGIHFAIIVSSVIFGLLHSVNIIGGKSMIDTIVQVVFAILIGILLAQLYLITNSIIPGMIWHFVNNFFNSISNKSESATQYFTLLLIVLALSIIYTIYLFLMMKKERSTRLDEPDRYDV
ncbi:CPBP family intramembrane glutamic endopeptidase [Bacillus chungangensis]|uniref:Membrane protease YdiL (CAAX protease family) n=1 Tax=Bacillus chungangensis TaxID=587633 RepID=A0ABT9WXK0_9BACI|nr:CPBP family intramembrane glutamic endopeptidase [Bacillus chungangensis]MDQ0177959.1 membrane protease YdiL (CAAX protease family) [Bacillus chungangensis]